ncbi:MAG: hypothetical protein D3M94_07905 [Rhodocyclales bacterium GT-UBC]|nr:MAG: hypothetical protein D3M94_07905 [Rhodocyclales bacterium GT-UBC]
MTSPNTSSTTSIFQASSNPNIDPLLNEAFEKWGGALGQGAVLSYSFPWLNGQSAWWQSPSYSTENEPGAAQHFGFNAVQIGAARSALQAWSNVANLQFTEVSESSSNVGDFRFAFSSALPNTVWGWSSYPDNYWASAADVWVNAQYGRETDWSAGTYNFEALMHEIGHGLGLKHPGNYGGGVGPFLDSALDDRNHTIMSYNDENNVYPDAAYVNGVWGWRHYYIYQDSPMVLDIAAIQYLYGANMAYRTGNDTYAFSPANPFFHTIWDAGGVDTIDASAYLLNCLIDLTPGHYSSLRIAPAADTGGATTTYDGSDCLGIAYGCLIENAIGGSGNDTFVGNAANNVIDGGAGGDTLSFSGSFAQYRFAYDQPSGFLVITDQVSGRDGQDAVRNIERFVFADGSRALSELGQSQSGSAANDIFYSGPGSDAFDGGGGVDTCLYGGVRSAYRLLGNATGWTVSGANDGTDVLINVERLQFQDKRIALDVAGKALETLEFIGVVAPVLRDNLNVRGTILGMLDQGQSLLALCQLALDAGLLPTEKAALARSVYNNVFNTSSGPEQNLANSLIAYIEQNGAAKFVAAVAGLNINVDLVGLQQGGMEFL